MTSGFRVRRHLPPAARAKISAGMKRAYRANGSRMRAIDAANGRRARGSHWAR